MKKVLIIILAVFLFSCEKEQVDIIEKQLVPIDSINPDAPLRSATDTR